MNFNKITCTINNKKVQVFTCNYIILIKNLLKKNRINEGLCLIGSYDCIDMHINKYSIYFPI